MRRDACHDAAVRRVLLALAAVAAATGSAVAHVAPSEDTNNRYVKLTAMADRVRIAYTILVGEQPGRTTRRGLDTDGDGTISDAEADAWGDDLAEAVRTKIQVQLDGSAVPFMWSEVSVGMDDRRVAGGAFSVDMIAWLCTPGGGPRHELTLVDRFALTPAGETEVRVADEPGIRVDVAKVGAAEMAGHVARFDAIAAPFSDGVRLVWDAARARPLADGRCARPTSAAKKTPRWPFAIGGGIVAIALIAIAAGRRRRARKTD
jgi:hypothetical protein